MDQLESFWKFATEKNRYIHALQDESRESGFKSARSINASTPPRVYTEDEVQYLVETIKAREVDRKLAEFAYEALFLEYARDVKKFVRKFSRDKSEGTIEDIVSSVMLQLWKDVGSYRQLFKDDGTHVRFSTWLYKIVIRCVAAGNKRGSIRIELVDDMPLGSPDDDQSVESKLDDLAWAAGMSIKSPESELEWAQVEKEYEACADKLSDEHRICFEMYYSDRFLQDEIASLLEISEGTVKSRLNTARKVIENCLLKKMGIKAGEGKRDGR